MASSRELKHKTVGFKTDKVNDDGTFTGYASVFGVEDSYGEIVDPGAFSASLKAIKASGDPLPALWQHDSTQPIGGYDVLSEDPRGLSVAGFLMVNEIPQAAQAHALMKRRVVKGLSIGYYVQDYVLDEKAKVLHLKTLDLVEISVCTFPANPEAEVDDVKALMRRKVAAGGLPTEREFEAFLRAHEWSRREANIICRHGLPELRKRAGDEPEPELDEISQRAMLAALKGFGI